MFYRRIILVDKTFGRETTVKKIIYNVTMANRDISSIELFAIIVTLDFTFLLYGKNDIYFSTFCHKRYFKKSYYTYTITK